jgi:hypothetical protein
VAEKWFTSKYLKRKGNPEIELRERERERERKGQRERDKKRGAK